MTENSTPDDLRRQKLEAELDRINAKLIESRRVLTASQLTEANAAGTRLGPEVRFQLALAVSQEQLTVEILEIEVERVQANIYMIGANDFYQYHAHTSGAASRRIAAGRRAAASRERVLRQAFFIAE